MNKAPKSYVDSEKVSRALAEFGFKAEVVAPPIKWYVKRGWTGTRSVAVMNARGNGLPAHLGAPCSLSVFEDDRSDFTVSLAFASVSLLIASMKKVL